MMIALDPIPQLSGTMDNGLLVLIVTLFGVSILAHRLWRGKIRAEDELTAFQKDLAFSQGRYRVGWRKLNAVAAFADRVTGLVVEPTPGWTAAGLPEGGRKIWGEDTAAESAWRAIPGPDAENRVGPAIRFDLTGRSFLAEPMDGENLGIVLVQEIQ